MKKNCIVSIKYQGGAICRQEEAEVAAEQVPAEAEVSAGQVPAGVDSPAEVHIIIGAAEQL